MASSDEIIKKEFMIKRSQLKSKFKSVNFKSRWFVLTEKTLRYHDGSLHTGAGKEKGRVTLKDVIAVENADDEPLGRRPNAFQVVYTDKEEFTTLYIIAVHADMRTEWIRAIRAACHKLFECSTFSDVYHPGLWLYKDNRYTCCDSINRRSQGCQQTTFRVAPAAPPRPDLPRVPSDPPILFQNGASPAPDRPVPKPREKKDSSSNLKKVIARYDYNPDMKDDLALITGEEYVILDSSKPAWWKARNIKGQEGYIPCNYVEEITEQGLEQYGWYVRGMSRQQSEEMLKNEAREGAFIVRDSSQQGTYTISIYTQEVPEGMVRHYHIKKKDGLFYLSDKHSFATIPDLIYYHKHNSGGLVVRLRSPPSAISHEEPTLPGFGHDKWEIAANELEVLEEIGRGQFGTVHKGIWKKKKEVAVKAMQYGSMKEDDFIEEAQTMMQFNHKNLVQLYGVVTKHRPIYIVLEFMRNGALLSFIRRRKQTLLAEPSKLLEMCTQVCSAMKYLEEKQVIHRDLAARNCLVGEHNIVKVADFGLARFVLDDEYTSSSGAKFPVKWAPPEVLSYTKFSSKSDVWAFGVLMWEIWTGGEFPYGRMRNPEVVDYVCNKNGILTKPEACPEPIYDIFKHCWRRHPDQRPKFSELMEMLLNQQQLQNYAD